MTETVWASSDEPPLRGILGTGQGKGGGPIVLFLTAGYLPRIGPHRIYVKLCRALNSAGFTSLRLDFSGIGDSKTSAFDSLRQAGGREGADIRRAMDQLEEAVGVGSFVLFAMCMGARPALEVATHDRRVQGLVLVNARFSLERESPSLSRRNQAETNWRLYGRKLWSLASWRRLLAGQSNYRELVRTLRAKLAPGRELRRQARLTVRPFWETLARSDLPVHLVYSEGSRYWDPFRSIHEPVLRALPSPGRISIGFLESVDHTFTPVWSHDRLREVLLGWLLVNFRKSTPEPRMIAPSRTGTDNS
jgi:pimeloyl-ACP methyl ester carboxylesterase